MPSQRGLLSLPPETLNQIISYLFPPFHYTASTGLAVLLTCKQLYNVALPLSVQTFIGTSVGTHDDSDSNRILGFLRYITKSSPEVACYVQTIIVDSFSTNGNDDDDDDDDGEEDQKPPVLDEIEKQEYKIIIRESFKETDTPHWKEWRDDWQLDVESGKGDAYLALILAVCPNIHTLCFGEPYNPRNTVRLVEVAANRSRVAPPLSPSSISGIDLMLTKLKDVFHESEESKYGYMSFTATAWPFLQLPSIRTYECVMANGEDGSAGSMFKIPRGSSELQHVLLRNSCITAGVLEAITGSCRALRSFEYTRGVYHMYDLEMMPLEVIKAMLPHAATLESLYLNFEDNWQKIGWRDTPKSLYMGIDLKQMVALRRLTAGMQTLTGMLDMQPEELFEKKMPLAVKGATRLVECLPLQLEFLEIHGCGKAILNQLSELLGAIDSGDFPNLTHVRLLFNQETTDEALVRDCLKGYSDGIKLEIVFQTLDHRRYDLCPTYTLPEISPDTWMQNICSRVSDPTLASRNLWLATRGSNKGRADENKCVIGIDL